MVDKTASACLFYVKKTYKSKQPDSAFKKSKIVLSWNKNCETIRSQTKSRIDLLAKILMN